MKRSLSLLVCMALWLAACSTVSPQLYKTPTPSPAPAGTAVPTRDPSIVPDMKIDTIMLGENPHDPGGIAVALSLQPNVDAPNTNVTISMPEEASMLTGAQAWSGDLAANQALFLSLTIQIDKLSKPGVIKVESISYPKDAPKLEKIYNLYVRPVQNGKLEFSKTPFAP